jgi:hypothetical protein
VRSFEDVPLESRDTSRVMKKLALLLIVVACSKTEPTTTLASSAAATSAQTAVLKWSVEGDHAHYDDVVRARLAAAHLDDAGALFRGDVLEVTVPNATPERVAEVEKLVQQPYDVHFAAGDHKLAIEPGTLVDAVASNDPKTTAPTIAVTLDAPSGVTLSSWQGPIDLVVDDRVVLEGIVRDPAVKSGTFSLSFKNDVERDRVLWGLLAVKAGHLRSMQETSALK